LRKLVRNIDNHKANWKVIALINGEIEALSGPALKIGQAPTNGRSGKGRPITKLKPSSVQRKLIPGLIWCECAFATRRIST